MIVRDAEAIGGERAKILDFGIAKAQESTDASDASDSSAVKTRPGALMGTPKYMSPEQCRGSGEITGKSDVYSLGVMLYEMVSGRPPMVASAMGELIVMHIMVEPPSLHELDPTLPVELTQLIHSMLRKDPEARPAMTEVVRQLEQQGAGRSIPPAAAAATLGGGEKSHLPSPSFPEVVAGMLATPTTLGTAAAQVRPLKRPALSWRLAAFAGVAFLGVGLLIRLSWVRHTPPERSPVTTGVSAAPAVSPGPVGPRKVHWRVTSEPAGARVVRIRDGVLLGTTPWQSDPALGTEKTQLLLQLPGFAEQHIELSQSADDERNEQLHPVPQTASPDSKKRGKRKSAASGAKAGRPAAEDLSDDELRIVK